MIEFISNDLLLLKMSGNYWTMMNKTGQIHPISRSLLKVLNRVPFHTISTRRIHEKGKILLMLESDELTTSVLFDTNGDVHETNEYDTDPSFGGYFNPTTKMEKTNDQVYADNNGKVWRIFNLSMEGEC